MAIIGRQDVAPRIPQLEEIAEEQVRATYNRLADTLWISLTGDPRPAYNVFVDDDTMFRIDPATNDVVGVEIEQFLERTLQARGAEGE